MGCLLAHGNGFDTANEQHIGHEKHDQFFSVYSMFEKKKAHCQLFCYNILISKQK